MEAPTTSTVPSSEMIAHSLVFSYLAVARSAAIHDPTLSLSCRRDERRSRRPLLHKSLLCRPGVATHLATKTGGASSWKANPVPGVTRTRSCFPERVLDRHQAFSSATTAFSSGRWFPSVSAPPEDSLNSPRGISYCVLRQPTHLAVAAKRVQPT